MATVIKYQFALILYLYEPDMHGGDMYMLNVHVV
jgi:hypothetical protein